MLIASFFLLGVFQLVMQTTLFQSLPAWLGRPDLLFILVVFIAYQVDLFRGAILAFLMGIMTDIFSGVFLGLYPVIYLLVFFFLKAVSWHTALNESVYQAPFAVISYLLASGAIFVSSSLLSPDSPIDWSWRVMLLQALLLSIIAVPLFSLYELYMVFCTKKLARWRPFKARTENRFRS